MDKDFLRISRISQWRGCGQAGGHDTPCCCGHALDKDSPHRVAMECFLGTMKATYSRSKLTHSSPPPPLSQPSPTPHTPQPSQAFHHNLISLHSHSSNYLTELTMGHD
ncbi:hypothetical protein E2C01_079507 [Portunus trituberculatus]|uniref:Uncharacterized protein n=1 Tax=Portunus trituberculatus TaxID=210409 RepID=A0A5B7IVT8_PORTR|nr:hypothetical protein [Portunus trituberculatus]